MKSGNFLLHKYLFILFTKEIILYGKLTIYLIIEGIIATIYICKLNIKFFQCN